MQDNDNQKPLSRGEIRRRAMLDAAWDAVLDKGFSGITLNDIIRRSGGSRATLYQNFGGKIGLLAEMLRERCKEFESQLQISLDTKRDPSKALLEFAITIGEKLSQTEVIRFNHLLLTEGHHFPDIVEMFMCHGPRSTEQELAKYLASVATTGKLKIDDPNQAASLFIAMLVGQWTTGLMNHALEGKNLKTYEAEVNRRVRAATALFLSGTLPR